MTCLLLSVSVGAAGFRTNQVARARVVVYVEQKGRGALLYTNRQGRVVRRVNLGAVGLVGQWEAVAAGPQHSIWAASGGGVWEVSGDSRRARWVPSPGGALTQVWSDGRSVWVVTATARATWLWRLRGRRFADGERVPAGLLWMVAARPHPWVLLIRPLDVLLWWNGRIARRAPLLADLSAAAASDGVWVPGVRHGRPGLLNLTPRADAWHAAPDWRQAVTALTPPPVWGATVDGLVPVGAGGERRGHVVRWPGRALTTVQVASGRPDDLLLDAPAAGYWFDPETGAFTGDWICSLPQLATTLGVVTSP